MNPDDLILVVSLSQTKAECIERLGLSHTTRNYRILTEMIKRNKIDARHLKGIKVTDWVATYGDSSFATTN